MDKPWYRRKRYVIPAAVIGVLVLLIALDPGPEDESEPTADTEPVESVPEPSGSEPEPPPEPEPGPDPEPEPEQRDDLVAESACRHWRNVLDDTRAGVLTDPELREKVKEVHADARHADAPEIASASEELLAAATAGDADRFRRAADRFNAACDDL